MSESKFKVGDRVRLNQDYCPKYKKGWEGVVTKVKSGVYTFHGDLITVLSDDQKSCICFERRFDLVSKEKTDRELANEFRQTRLKMIYLRNQLVNRGFSVLGSTLPVDAGGSPVIKKTVTTEVVL